MYMYVCTHVMCVLYVLVCMYSIYIYKYTNYYTYYYLLHVYMCTTCTYMTCTCTICTILYFKKVIIKNCIRCYGLNNKCLSRSSEGTCTTSVSQLIFITCVIWLDLRWLMLFEIDWIFMFRHMFEQCH